MEIFTNTVGISPAKLADFIQWLFSFVTILFGVTVIRGSYSRWVDGDMTITDVLIDIVLAFCVIALVSILIN